MSMRMTVCALLAVAIAGCSSSGGGTAIPGVVSAGSVAATRARAEGSAAIVPLSGKPATFGNAAFAYDQRTLPVVRQSGLASLPGMHLFIGLTMRDESGLLKYAADASTPRSSLYRHFLTPSQIADRFGASSADQSKAVQYFRSYGLKVTTFRQRDSIVVRGSQQQVQRAFDTQIGWFVDANGTRYYAPVSTPHTAIPLKLSVVHGLISLPAVRTMSVQGAGGITTSLNNGLSPAQLAGAYDYRGAYAKGYTGAGATVAIIGTGGFAAGSPQAFRTIFKVPGQNAVTVVPVLETPPPVTPPCSGDLPKCNPDGGEPNIDSQQAMSLAYGANILFYLAYDSKSKQIGLPLAHDEVAQALSDNVADALSLSYGQSELTAVYNDFYPDGTGTGPTQFAEAAAEGMAVFVASGDAGANAGSRNPGPYDSTVSVSYPTADENVVSVGATLTPVSTSGQLTGPITAWGLQTNAGSGGSGGGTSVFFAQPAFQRGAKNVAGATRNTPDIALEGDDYTGVAVLEYGGTSDQYIFPDGGTSVATPEAAAMWSLVLQACKQNTTCVSRGSGSHPYRLGNPNPLFYEDIYADAGTYAGAFYDVVFGSNSQLSYCDKPGSKDCPKPGTTPTPVPTLVPGGYQAGPGYDRVTGLGAPFGAELIQTVLSEVTK